MASVSLGQTRIPGGDMKLLRSRTRWTMLVWGLLTLLAAADARADVRLPALISDHMVLQQGMEVAIWGAADPGESIIVKFRGQQGAAVAGADGKWRVYLDPMDAGGP